jgi:hypothetical protein
LVTGGATGPSYYLADGVPFYEGNNLPTTYSLATSTSAATPTVGANYFAFTGLTGASQTIDLNADVSAGYNNATKDEFVGFEIVNTASAPEPSTYALLMAGAFVLGALRLRRTVNS